MPKMKTHRGAAKRFKKSGTGRVRHQKRNKRHILTKKSTHRKRRLRLPGELEGADRKRVLQLIPYE